MKKYIGLIIGIVVFVLLIAGAGALYTQLSEEYGTGQNLIVNKEAGEESDTMENTQQEAKQKPEAMQESESAQETDVIQESDKVQTDTMEQSEAEPEKVMAIDFSVENAEGEEVTLLSMVGKPMVLNFWASWCGPCKNELPDFQAAYEKYAGEVEFVMVNMTDGTRETKEIASAYMEEQGFSLPVYYDTAQDAAYTYGVYSLPTTYFIAPDGEIVAGAQGMIDGETLEYGISLIYNTAE